MYLLYLDEAGDPSPKPGSSNFFVLGAAALFEGKWAELDQQFRRLIERFFPDESCRPREIHMDWLHHGRRHFRRLTPQQRQAMISECCAVVGGLLPSELVFFTAFVEKRFWFSQNQGKGGEDLYVELFEQIASRFDFFLRRRYSRYGAPSKGILVADENKSSLAQALKRHYRHVQQHGHRWGHPVYNLIETVFFLQSEDSPGVQLADLCASGVWRFITRNETTIIEKIRDYFDREPLDSTRNPGKWHGVYYRVDDLQLRQRIRGVWPE